MASEKQICVILVSFANCRDSRYRGWGAQEVKTTCPKWMQAGVMIGETLSSGVEIQYDPPGDQLYVNNLICAKYGSSLLPRFIHVISPVDTYKMMTSMISESLSHPKAHDSQLLFRHAIPGAECQGGTWAQHAQVSHASCLVAA